jgi:hypothetical protein
MRPLEQRRRVPQRGHRITEQLNPFVAAVRESSGAERDPKRARCSEDLHICEFGLCKIACGLVLSKP